VFAEKAADLVAIVTRFGVDRSAFGIDRSTFGIDRSAGEDPGPEFGIDRGRFGVDRCQFGIDRSAFGVDRESGQAWICEAGASDRQDCDPEKP
jgi:hypothetical protein